MGDGFFSETHYVWLTVAVLLGLAELMVPGVFLIWLAAAAAITGIASLFIDMTLAGQLTLFGISTVASVIFGRRWYLTRAVESSDPLLNDRGARLIGTTVTVVQPINATSGRVKVGDSEWKARGSAMDIGATARVVEVASGILVVEEVSE